MSIKEILITLKKVLYRCFFIGLIFLVLAALIYMPCKCFVANIYQNIFGISSQVYYTMWASFVGLIKTIIIFIFLVPALAVNLVSYEYDKKI